MAALDVVFLLLLALAVTATGQITGVLLVFAVLVAPPAAAQQLTRRPLAGLLLGIVFALLVVWLGLRGGVLLAMAGRLLHNVVRVRRLRDRPGCRKQALMFAHAFVRNAYLAGTFIALASGCVGWFVVARAQLFAGDALSHVAFVGAIGAAVVARRATGAVRADAGGCGGDLGAGRAGRADDAAIGTVFAWILGIGVLLIALLATSGRAAPG